MMTTQGESFWEALLFFPGEGDAPGTDLTTGAPGHMKSYILTSPL